MTEERALSCPRLWVMFDQYKSQYKWSEALSCVDHVIVLLWLQPMLPRGSRSSLYLYPNAQTAPYTQIFHKSTLQDRLHLPSALQLPILVSLQALSSLGISFAGHDCASPIPFSLFRPSQHLIHGPRIRYPLISMPLVVICTTSPFLPTLYTSPHTLPDFSTQTSPFSTPASNVVALASTIYFKT